MFASARCSWVKLANVFAFTLPIALALARAIALHERAGRGKALADDLVGAVGRLFRNVALGLLGLRGAANREHRRHKQDAKHSLTFLQLAPIIRQASAA